MAKRPIDEDELFLQAMRNMGLDAAGGRAHREEDLDFEAMMLEAAGERPTPQAGARGDEALADAPKVEASGGQDLASEDALFAAAMSSPLPPPPATDQPGGDGALGTTASVALTAKRSQGTRRALARAIKSGALIEDEVLDLHGKTRDQARRALTRCVERSRRDGLDLVKVITGRGLHSVGDAVLMGAVAQWLAGELRGHIREVIKAPRDKGGEGARYVFLRAPEV